MSDLLQFDFTQTRAAALAGMPAERLDALAATIEFAPLGIAHFDRDGRFLLANRCFCQMLGYPREEVLRRSFLEITFAEDVAHCLALHTSLAAGDIPSYRHEKRFVRGDGELVWCRVTVSAARHADGGVDFFIGMAEDITEQRRTEEQLRRAHEEARAHDAQVRALANAIPQMVWIARPDGTRSWFNDRWYDFTGMQRGEAEGWGWQRAHHPDHGPRAIRDQLACFARGDVWEDTVPLRAADGTYRWFLSRAVPVRDASGQIACWFGSNTDITEQVETLASAQKAKGLRDEMVAVVAHDLRNPLHTIALGAATLESPNLDMDRRLRLLAIIRQTAINMGKLLDDLLDVSRLESGTFAIAMDHVSPAALADAMREHFEARAAQKGIALDVHVDSALPRIMGDSVRLEQVLSNILGNALKFTPDGGRIDLACRTVADGVEFAVRDTGPGIAQEHLGRLFDRFWKADPASRGGAGLGLAIARGIVDAHGGRIWAESEPGSGATVRFVLPTRQVRLA